MKKILVNKRKNLLETIQKFLDKYDSKLYMLSDLGHLYNPLNFLGQRSIKT